MEGASFLGGGRGGHCLERGLKNSWSVVGAPPYSPLGETLHSWTNCINMCDLFVGTKELTSTFQKKMRDAVTFYNFSKRWIEESFVCYLRCFYIFKFWLGPQKKKCFICFNEIPLKVIKNGFYSILKAPFVLKIFKFLSWLCSHREKKVSFKMYDVTTWLTSKYNTHIAQ